LSYLLRVMTGIVAFVLAGCAAPKLDVTGSCPLPDVEASVDVIDVPGGHGTAWVVAPGRMVTARHIADRMGSGRVHETLDVAVLHRGGGQRPLPLGPPPAVGQPVWLIGYAQVAGNRGIVRTLGHWQRDGSEAWVSAAMHPGASGGPVVDCEGRVVAVSVGTGSAPIISPLPGASMVPHLGVVVPISKIREWLNQE